MFRFRRPSALFLIASVAIMMGLFLRVWNFGVVPSSLYWDEMAIWNDAQSIAQTGRDIHNRPWNQAIFISYGDYKMPMYIWLTALVTLATDNAVVGVRVVSLVAGITLIPAMAWLAHEVQKLWLSKRIENSWTWPLLTAAVVALAPVELHFSRVGFEGHLAVVLLVLASASLLRSFSRVRLWQTVLWIVLATVLSTAATYAYFSTRFVWVPVVIAAGVSLVFTKPRSKNLWGTLVLAGLGLVAWVLALIPLYSADFSKESTAYRLSTPSILNQTDLPHEVNQWRLWMGNGPVTRRLVSSPLMIGLQGVRHQLAFVSPDYLFFEGDGKLRHGTLNTGVLWWWSAPFLFIGIVAAGRFSKPLAGLLLVWWGFGVLPAAVPLDVPHALRSLNANPVLFLLIGLGGVYAWEWVQRQSVWKQWFVCLGVIVCLVLSSVWWLAVQPAYAQRSASEWQDGYLQLSEFLQQERDSYTTIALEPFDSRFYLYYQPWSGLSWQEIQNLPTAGFQRQQLGNVSFEDPEVLTNPDPGGLILLRASTPLPHHATLKDTIYDSNGKAVFHAVEVSPNP